MSNKYIDCLFIGHTGDRLIERQKAVNQMFPLKKIKLENPLNGAIAYLGTYLYRNGLTFDYINSFTDEKAELEKKLNKKMTIVAITTTFCKNIKQVKEIVSFVRKRKNDVKIVVGGAFMTMVIRRSVKSEVEYILRYINADFYINSYHGENTLLSIIYNTKKQKSVNEIDNLIYYKDNHYIFSRQVDEVGDPENNTVEWSLFKKRIGNAVVLRTSVSCPFQCAYCSFPQNAGKYQMMGIQAIEQQLDEIDKLGNVKIVNFIDDTFNIPPKRFKAILKIIKQNKYKFRWHGYFRSQFADREMVELMRDSNCDGVFLGFESGNQRVLDIMNKRAKVEEYIRGHDLLKEYGITTYALFIVGFPGETKESVQDTEDFIKRIRPTFYYINTWYCDRSTPIWLEKDKYKINGKENQWSHATMNSQTAGLLVKEVENRLKDYTTKLNVQSNHIFQVLNMGVGLEQIKQALNGRF